jgi:predicted DNA-binding mobile mystery protein A
MTGAQLASRMGVRAQTVDVIEKSEAAGKIQLNTLRRAAEALGCKLVYALVPNTSLEEAVKIRGRQIAIHDLQRVAHTMRLEAQETGDTELEARIEAYIRDILKDRELWTER